ncbi:hypothetical protein HELRODRAFT_191855 [Helobdella robusta]|uniref:Ubiquitin-like domain-containing protein n=1 Tax=Helobdella robusta TaxID=6412 RepID=T1FTD1_HELRO|nr:hypothetical protein HELRODRAFT_191855 [Helobdella robusta]ESO03529.1 hypothetical protein HELRODRAFT_191855 [Helobdella robusta]
MAKFQVRHLNENLTCGICKGYLVGAVTVTICMHSYECVNRLKFNRLSGHQRINRDNEESEKETNVSSAADLTNNDNNKSYHQLKKFNIIFDGDVVNVSLTAKSTNNLQPENTRYFLCPVKVQIGHLLKLITHKFNNEFRDSIQILICHEGRLLAEDLTLMDVYYMCNIKKSTSLNLAYFVYCTNSLTNVNSCISSSNDNNNDNNGNNNDDNNDNDGDDGMDVDEEEEDGREEGVNQDDCCNNNNNDSKKSNCKYNNINNNNSSGTVTTTTTADASNFYDHLPTINQITSSQLSQFDCMNNNNTNNINSSNDNIFNSISNNKTLDDDQQTILNDPIQWESWKLVQFKEPMAVSQIGSQTFDPHFLKNDIVVRESNYADNSLVLSSSSSSSSSFFQANHIGHNVAAVGVHLDVRIANNNSCNDILNNNDENGEVVNIVKNGPEVLLTGSLSAEESLSMSQQDLDDGASNGRYDANHVNQDHINNNNNNVNQRYPQQLQNHSIKDNNFAAYDDDDESDDDDDNGPSKSKYAKIGTSLGVSRTEFEESLHLKPCRVLLYKLPDFSFLQSSCDGASAAVQNSTTSASSAEYHFSASNNNSNADDGDMVMKTSAGDPSSDCSENSRVGSAASATGQNKFKKFYSMKTLIAKYEKELDRLNNIKKKLVLLKEKKKKRMRKKIIDSSSSSSSSSAASAVIESNVPLNNDSSSNSNAYMMEAHAYALINNPSSDSSASHTVRDVTVSSCNCIHAAPNPPLEDVRLHPLSSVASATRTSSTTTMTVKLEEVTPEEMRDDDNNCSIEASDPTNVDGNQNSTNFLDGNNFNNTEKNNSRSFKNSESANNETNGTSSSFTKTHWNLNSTALLANGRVSKQNAKSELTMKVNRAVVACAGNDNNESVNPNHRAARVSSSPSSTSHSTLSSSNNLFANNFVNNYSCNNNINYINCNNLNNNKLLTNQPQNFMSNSSFVNQRHQLRPYTNNRLQLMSASTTNSQTSTLCLTTDSKPGMCCSNSVGQFNPYRYSDPRMLNYLAVYNGEPSSTQVVSACGGYRPMFAPKPGTNFMGEFFNKKSKLGMVGGCAILRSAAIVKQQHLQLQQQLRQQQQLQQQHQQQQQFRQLQQQQQALKQQQPQLKQHQLFHPKRAAKNNFSKSFDNDVNIVSNANLVSKSESKNKMTSTFGEQIHVGNCLQMVSSANNARSISNSIKVNDVASNTPPTTTLTTNNNNNSNNNINNNYIKTTAYTLLPEMIDLANLRMPPLYYNILNSSGPFQLSKFHQPPAKKQKLMKNKQLSLTPPPLIPSHTNHISHVNRSSSCSSSSSNVRAVGMASNDSNVVESPSALSSAAASSLPNYCFDSKLRSSSANGLELSYQSVGNSEFVEINQLIEDEKKNNSNNNKIALMVVGRDGDRITTMNNNELVMNFESATSPSNNNNNNKESLSNKILPALKRPMKKMRESKFLDSLLLQVQRSKASSVQNMESNLAVGGVVNEVTNSKATVMNEVKFDGDKDCNDCINEDGDRHDGGASKGAADDCISCDDEMSATPLSTITSSLSSPKSTAASLVAPITSSSSSSSSSALTTTTLSTSSSSSSSSSSLVSSSHSPPTSSAASSSLECINSPSSSSSSSNIIKVMPPSSSYNESEAVVVNSGNSCTQQFDSCTQQFDSTSNDASIIDNSDNVSDDKNNNNCSHDRSDDIVTSQAVVCSSEVVQCADVNTSVSIAHTTAAATAATTTSDEVAPAVNSLASCTPVGFSSLDMSTFSCTTNAVVTDDCVADVVTATVTIAATATTAATAASCISTACSESLNCSDNITAAGADGTAVFVVASSVDDEIRRGSDSSSSDIHDRTTSKSADGECSCKQKIESNDDGVDDVDDVAAAAAAAGSDSSHCYANKTFVCTLIGNFPKNIVTDATLSPAVINPALNTDPTTAAGTTDKNINDSGGNDDVHHDDSGDVTTAATYNNNDFTFTEATAAVIHIDSDDKIRTATTDSNNVIPVNAANTATAATTAAKKAAAQKTKTFIIIEPIFQTTPDKTMKTIKLSTIESNTKATTVITAVSSQPGGKLPPPTPTPFPSSTSASTADDPTSRNYINSNCNGDDDDDDGYHNHAAAAAAAAVAVADDDEEEEEDDEEEEGDEIKEVACGTQKDERRY